MLTAEPTPAFSRGTEAITDSVVGGITLAMPAPCTKNITASAQTGVLAEMNRNAPSVTATIPTPAAQTAFGPYFFTRAALRGAKMSWEAANGRNSTPVCSGEYPRTSCR